MKEPKVFIGMPTYGRPDIRALSNCQVAAGSTFLQVQRGGSAPVQTVRNLLVRSFLYKDTKDLKDPTDFTHLLFVDDDTLIPPDTIPRLLALDADIATGMTPSLHSTEKPAVHLNCAALRAEESAGEDRVWFGRPPAEPCELSACGLSCCLIKREVFEAFNGESLWFIWGERLNGTIIGEDILFTSRARELGFKIMVEPTVVCGHLKEIDIAHLIEYNGPLFDDRVEDRRE